MTLQRRWAAGLAVLPLLLLTACSGWHLAGQRALPVALQRVYIDMVQPYEVSEPPLQTALQARLAARGAQVLSEPQAGATVLRLSNLKETREVLALGQDGTAIEYRLVTVVTFQLSRNGRLLTEPATQSVSRDYSFNPQQILAKSAEEARLQRYTQGQLSALLLLRLEALLRAAPAPAATSSHRPRAAACPPRRRRRRRRHQHQHQHQHQAPRSVRRRLLQLPRQQAERVFDRRPGTASCQSAGQMQAAADVGAEDAVRPQGVGSRQLRLQ
jgi:Rare lipoprotein B